MTIEVLYRYVQKKQQEIALEALVRGPQTPDVAFAYGKAVGVVAGLQIVLDTIDSVLREERNAEQCRI